MEPIIEMRGVSKNFKDKKAVDHLSFSIPKGTITAILGPNGAGKTTAVSMLLGLLEPTDGTVKLFGKPPKDRTVREQTGAMLQEVSVMDRLKVREVLELIRSYYPNPMELAELVRLTGLGPDDLNRYAEKLSGGQKRSLGFALALAGNPDLVFFDEPTVALTSPPGGAFGTASASWPGKGRRSYSRHITCRKPMISPTGSCCSIGAAW